MKRIFAILTFYSLILYQVYAMSVATDITEIGVKIGGYFVNPYDFIMGSVWLFAAFSYPKLVRREEGVNKTILLLIAGYMVYQVVVIFPLSILQGGTPVTYLARWFIVRSYILIIPFLYWHVLPLYKTFPQMYFPVALSGLVLFFVGFTNFISGDYILTNTGQARSLWGAAVLLFASVLIVHFYRPKRNLINFFFIIVMLIGFMLVNHRSSYVAFAVVFVISLYVNGKGTLKMIRNSVILLGSALLIISQIPAVWDSFIGRVVSSLNTGDDNAAGRLVRWYLSFIYFLKNPINGSMLKTQFYEDSEIFTGQYPPHNLIFETLSTQGLVGLLFFVVLFYYLFRTAYRNRTDQVSVQMLLCLAFYLIFAFMNATFFNTWVILLLMLPCATIMYRNKFFAPSPSVLAPELIVQAN